MRPRRPATGVGLRRCRPGRRPVRHQPHHRRPGLGRQDAVPRDRGPGAARTAHRRRSAGRHQRSELGGRGRERGGGGRHPGRRPPEPRPPGRAPGRAAPGRPPPRRAAPHPAQHGLPGRHRRGRAAHRVHRARHRHLVLPRAHRRGQGPGRAVRAAPDRVGPQRARLRAGRGAVRQAHAVDAAARGRGSRAGQAVHQHLALHQVRGGQPALHDRQRLRPRLRAHPGGDGPRLPPGRRPARAPGSPPGHAC